MLAVGDAKMSRPARRDLTTGQWENEQGYPAGSVLNPDGYGWDDTGYDASSRLAKLEKVPKKLCQPLFRLHNSF